MCSAPTNGENTSFIGKRIKHYQIKKGMRFPYLGRVISSVPGYPQWFNVIYCYDPTVYVYKLAEDYADGDLEIIAEGSTRQHYLVQIVICCYSLVASFEIQFGMPTWKQHKLLFSG